MLVGNRPGSDNATSHIAHDSLTAPLVRPDVLNANSSLASGSVALERLDLRSEGAGELIEGALRTVLLLNIFHMSEPACERHGSIVDGGHLRRKHGLHLVDVLPV